MSKMEKVRKPGELTWGWLRSVVDYDPLTGIFRWKSRPAYRCRPGEVAGCIHSNRKYWTIRLRGRCYLAHRLAIFLSSGTMPARDVEIDHINRDGLDNRLSNLRLATHAENRRNSKTSSNNGSGLKGAYFHKRSGKYRSAIRFEGTQHHLGTFETAQEAHGAYCVAAAHYYGEFARAA